MRLDPEAPESLDTGAPQVETDRRIAPLLRRKQERAVPEPNIEPRAAFSILRHARDDVRRNHAPPLELPTRFLLVLRLLEDDRADLGRQITIGEDVRAVVAAHPHHRAPNRRMIHRMARAVGGAKLDSVAAFAQRT